VNILLTGNKFHGNMTLFEYLHENNHTRYMIE